MADQPTFSRRKAKYVLASVIFSLPWIVWGMAHVHSSTDNSVRQWLPNDQQTQFYDRFRELFGSDEHVLVSWEGCTLQDERLEQFASAVERASESDDGPHAALREVVQNVTTGPRVYKRLQSEPLEISPRAARRRLVGTLLGPDQKTTCAAIRVSATSAQQRASALDAIRQLALATGVAEPDLRLTGDAVFSVAIDEEGKDAMDTWVWASALIALCMACLCLRSWRLALTVFLVSVLCQSICESIVYYSGGRMNLLVVMAPVLVYVLALSACVHLANYYRDALLHHDPRAAPGVALRAGWYPCLIASVTSALGLISLSVSQVTPVRAFGTYGASGVLCGFVVLVVVLPAVLVLFPLRPAKQRGNNDSASEGDKPSRDEIRSSDPEPSDPEVRDPEVRDPEVSDNGHGEQSNLEDARLGSTDSRGLLAMLGGWVVEQRLALLGVFVLGCAALSVGVSQIETSAEPLRFLPASSRWITDAVWYREHVGPMASVEIVIAVPVDWDADISDRMRMIAEIQRRTARLDDVHGVMSATTFAPAMPKPLSREGLQQHVRRFMTNRELRQHRGDFEREGYLATDNDWELWRVTARVSRFRELDYPDFVRKLEDELRPVLAATRLAPERVQLHFTGAVPLVFAAQRELLNALLVSFSLAMVLIGVVMAVVLKSVLGGLLSMGPNIFPALAAFGMMGWTGSIVDVGAMMTASIGLGIAVDDTLHFVTWYRRSVQGGSSRAEAIKEAFQRCATAMTHTTLIAGFGLAVFYFSGFQPVSQFGLMMFTLLATALVGDLLFLPALLATPLGRYFSR